MSYLYNNNNDNSIIANMKDKLTHGLNNTRNSMLQYLKSDQYKESKAKWFDRKGKNVLVSNDEEERMKKNIDNAQKYANISKDLFNKSVQEDYDDKKLIKYYADSAERHGLKDGPVPVNYLTKYGLDDDTVLNIAEKTRYINPNEAKNSKKPYITTYLQNDFKNNGLKITCIKKNGAVIVSGRPVIIFHPDGTAEHADITLACSTDIRETVTFELRAADSRLSAF